MATDLNSIMVIGRLTADPVLKYLNTGNAVVEFSIANNYFIPNNDKAVNYFDVVAFGKTAETVSKWLTKGKQIAISGSLRQDRWTDKEGASKSRIRIMMQSMQILSPRDAASSGGGDNSYSSNSGGANNYGNSSYGGGGHETPSNPDISSFSDDDEVPF